MSSGWFYYEKLKTMHGHITSNVVIPSADHRKGLSQSALQLLITQPCVLSSVQPSYCVDRTKTDDRNSSAPLLVSIQILEELCVSLHRNCWIGHKRVSPSMHTAVFWFVCVHWGTCLFTGFWRHSELNRHSLPSNTVTIFVLDCYITPDILQTVWSITTALFGDFAKIAKKRLLASSCLSVRPYVRVEQLCSHWRDFHEIWYLNILRNSV